MRLEIILYAGARATSRKVRRSPNQVGYGLQDPAIGALFPVSLYPNVSCLRRRWRTCFASRAVAVIAGAVGIRLRGPSFIEPSTVSPSALR